MPRIASFYFYSFFLIFYIFLLLDTCNFFLSLFLFTAYGRFFQPFLFITAHNSSFIYLLRFVSFSWNGGVSHSSRKVNPVVSLQSPSETVVSSNFISIQINSNYFYCSFQLLSLCHLDCNFLFWPFFLFIYLYGGFFRFYS